MPEKCECEIKEKIYWLTDEKFCVEREINVSGIMYSDYVQPKMLQIVKKIDNNNCLIKTGFYLHFQKETWLKKIIVDKAME